MKISSTAEKQGLTINIYSLEKTKILHYSLSHNTYNIFKQHLANKATATIAV